jgi:small subunit ribosomal protein S2
MASLPELVFAVDVRREATAIHEANLLNIPVIALVDTNCDPRDVDYVIPSNDDAIRAIKLLVGKIADAALEGKAMRKEEDIEAARPQAQAAMAGIDEPELADEDLLGAATLAKITARPVVAKLDADEEVLEIIEENLTEEVLGAEAFDIEVEEEVEVVEELIEDEPEAEE